MKYILGTLFLSLAVFYNSLDLSSQAEPNPINHVSSGIEFGSPAKATRVIPVHYKTEFGSPPKTTRVISVHHKTESRSQVPQINHLSRVPRDFTCLDQIRFYRATNGASIKVPAGVHMVADYDDLIVGIEIGGVVYRALDKDKKACTYYKPNFYGLERTTVVQLHPKINWYTYRYQ